MKEGERKRKRKSFTKIERDYRELRRRITTFVEVRSDQFRFNEEDLIRWTRLEEVFFEG